MAKKKLRKPIPTRIYPAQVDTSLTVFCFSFDPEIVRLAGDDLARIVIEQANLRLQITNEMRGQED